MFIGKRIRLTDWGRQYGLDPQSTWRMLNEGRLPAHLQVAVARRDQLLALVGDAD